jgi:acyl-CoA synthetase (AMP-forming)/AMP-acid ligase II
MRRIGEILSHGAALFPERPALSEEQQNWTLWTYAGLRRAVDEAAQALAALGARAGDRVLLVAENCAEMVALFFAASELDAWPVLASARLAPAEIDAIAAHCEPRLALFLSVKSVEAAAHARRRGAVLTDFGRLGQIEVDRISGEPVCEPPPVRIEDGVAAMIYTSGTTGTPKAAMLSHANLLYIGFTQAEQRRYTPGDKLYCVLPLAHIGGLSSILMGIFTAGACVCLAQRFSPAELGRALREQGITVVAGVPTLHVKFCEWARSNPELYAAPRLRIVTCASSPLDPAVKADVEALYGLPLQNGYGLTETAAVVCQTRLDEPRGDTSVGKALPGVSVRFVDEAGGDLPQGAVGEILVLGPNVFLGYYRNPDASRAAFTAEGWLKTGDLGYAAADGNVYIAGRAKDLIKRSGYNVYPLDVETALNAHPQVAICAVVGRARGADEEVLAFVQLREGSAAEPEELIAFLRSRLAAYKLPGVLRVLPQLPALHNGKVDRAAMRRLALELAAD